MLKFGWVMSEYLEVLQRKNIFPVLILAHLTTRDACVMAGAILSNQENLGDILRLN